MELNLSINMLILGTLQARRLGPYKPLLPGLSVYRVSVLGVCTGCLKGPSYSQTYYTIHIIPLGYRPRTFYCIILSLSAFRRDCPPPSHSSASDLLFLHLTIRRQDRTLPSDYWVRLKRAWFIQDSHRRQRLKATSP